MSSLLTLPATELVRLVAAGEVSAADLVRLHLERIEATAATLNALVEVSGERALEEARRQDERAAGGEARAPLGGLPVTIKSAIEVAGLKCEAGSPSRAGLLARADAVVVSRLRAAGAIVLGTTNVAEMLMGYESVNPLYGRTSNPWDIRRTPGGSSGGEAAAIAAGCSAAGVGSDGGGSIRVPAHFTGICGFKPTPGRIPATGHQPPCLGPFSLIGVVGPMARSVGDLVAIDRAIAGPDASDPMSWPDLRDLPAEVRERPRIGFFEDDGSTPVTKETRLAVRAAASALDAFGFVVEEYRPSVLAEAGRLWDVFFAEMGLALLGDVLHGQERTLPILATYVNRRLRDGPMTALDLATAWIDRDTARATLLAEMAAYPILICPVASVPAFLHDERHWTIEGREVGYLEAMRYSQWFNVLGNPSVVVPAGRSPEGLPIGVQVVGRPYADADVLRVSGVIERACRGLQELRDRRSGD
jgi:Asp-tRNA(Asn)/Glu-tRNA(Gln) amidotransferase A subunit family amidase